MLFQSLIREADRVNSEPQTNKSISKLEQLSILIVGRARLQFSQISTVIFEKVRTLQKCSYGKQNPISFISKKEGQFELAE